MGWRGLFEGWHLVVLIIVIVLVFGWKRLPDAARSLGRSMRIFKAEVEEMKTDPKPSAASRDTVRGETVAEQRAERERAEQRAQADVGGSATTASTGSTGATRATSATERPQADDPLRTDAQDPPVRDTQATDSQPPRA